MYLQVLFVFSVTGKVHLDRNGCVPQRTVLVCDRKETTVGKGEDTG